MQNISDLKLKTKDELIKLDSSKLAAELKDAKLKLFNVKMKLNLDELKQTHLVKALRRYVALIKTVSVELTMWKK